MVKDIIEKSHKYTQIIVIKTFYLFEHEFKYKILHYFTINICEGLSCYKQSMTLVITNIRGFKKTMWKLKRKKENHKRRKIFLNK